MTCSTGIRAKRPDLRASSEMEMSFLNIGVEACVENGGSRPWEPDKYPSAEAQNNRLPILQKVRGKQGYDFKLLESEAFQKQLRTIFAGPELPPVGVASFFDGGEEMDRQTPTEAQ